MFRRITTEDWHTLLAILAFAVTAGIFLIAVIRTLRMERQREEHLANLPLKDDTAPPTDHEQSR